MDKYQPLKTISVSSSNRQLILSAFLNTLNHRASGQDQSRIHYNASFCSERDEFDTIFDCNLFNVCLDKFISLNLNKL